MTILFFISLAIFIISIACLFAFYMLDDIANIEINKLAMAITYIVLVYSIAAVVIIGVILLIKTEI